MHRQLTAIVLGSLSIGLAATPAAAEPPSACVVRACDGIAALRTEVGAATVELPGRTGLDNHLAVAERKCRDGNLAAARAQLGAFAHAALGRSPQAVPPAAAGGWASAARALADRLGALVEGAACVTPTGAVGLAAQCPLAGSLVPLADDFADGEAAPAWSAAVAPDTHATLVESDGGLSLRAGPAAAGADGQSPFGYVSRCQYPAQDFAMSAAVTVDADADGEYMLQLHADGAAVVLGHESTAGHGFFVLGFADGVPGPDAVAIELPDMRGRDLRLELARTTTDHVQTVAMAVVDVTTGALVFARTVARATAFTRPSRAAVLAGFAAGDAPLATATDARMRVDDLRSTLRAPLPEFVGGPAPLTLDGQPYSEGGTRYLVAGALTVLTEAGPVAGADGTVDLAAALVELDGQRVTYYTDLTAADLAAYLAALDPAARLVAYLPGVLAAAGPDRDYVFVAAALDR